LVTYNISLANQGTNYKTSDMGSNNLPLANEGSKYQSTNVRTNTSGYRYAIFER
jgi:hypothetical protein